MERSHPCVQGMSLDQWITLRHFIPAHSIMPEELKKRIWCYCGSPKNFLIPVHTCGAEPQWSEFEGHCWCPQCEIDYKPEDNGIFDGPILLKVTNLCGIVFDRFIIETREVQLQDDWMVSDQLKSY